MGLPGTPTFTDVRTSIATHAKNTHSPRDWYKVAQFMCQDTSTADRFYVLNLNAKQAAEHRSLFESAVEGQKTTALKKSGDLEAPHRLRAKGGQKSLQADSQLLNLRQPITLCGLSTDERRPAVKGVRFGGTKPSEEPALQPQKDDKPHAYKKYKKKTGNCHSCHRRSGTKS